MKPSLNLRIENKSTLTMESATSPLSDKSLSPRQRGSAHVNLLTSSRSIDETSLNLQADIINLKVQLMQS